MESEIKKLRKKFLTFAVIIVFCILTAMIAVLNVLMTETYKATNRSAKDIVAQAAESNLPSLNSEHFEFSDLKKRYDGSYYIYKDPKTIKSITLYGNIKSSNPTDKWYCAGGGILYQYQTSEYGTKYIHNEYVFNREVTSITVDIINYDTLLDDQVTIKADENKILGDYFLISGTWWTSSSAGDSKVTLDLSSVDIQYKEDVSINDLDSFIISYTDFSDCFKSGLPDALNNINSFYIVTDKKNRIIEINNGNLVPGIEEKEAENLIQSISNGEDTVQLDSFKYQTNSIETDDMMIYTFICDNQENASIQNLLIISTILGVVVFAILFVVIYIYSYKVVKPVSESYKMQNQFISNASHELKTPITVISATTDLLEKNFGQDRWIDTIRAQSSKMRKLVHEMLELTRMSEIERVNLKKEVFNISNITSNSALYFEGKAFENNKLIESDITEDLFFEGDETKIDRLIGILIDNAIKYADDNTTIYIKLKEEKNNIIFTCENDCTDFNTESLKHLFERFYRADESHSNQKEGYGLGLSIAKQIAEFQNCTLNADYVNNKVVFTVDFGKKATSSANKEE